MIHESNRPKLSLGCILSDGEGIGFRLERGDGQSIDLACTMDDLSDIFHYLAALAKEAGAVRDAQVPAPSKTYNDLTPIPAEGMGFQPGPGLDETMLVMRLTGFDMAFAVPNSGLARLSADFARIAATLSADHKRPN